MGVDAATRGLTDVERRNLDAVRGVHPFWNRGDVDGVLSFYDDEITWKNIALEEVYAGKDGVREYLTRLFAAFPDLTFTADQVVAHGDDVAEKWTIRGTHLGTFMGVPPTGRPVEIVGMSMLTMRDGKFLRDEFYSDGAAVMRQLGLLPSLAALQGRIGRTVLWLAVKLRPHARRAARR